MASTSPSNQFFGIRVTEGVPFLHADLAHFLKDRAPITSTTDGPIPIPDPSKPWSFDNLLIDIYGFPDMLAEWAFVGTLKNPALPIDFQRTVFARRRAVNGKSNMWEIELVASYFSFAVNDDMDMHRMSEEDLEFGNKLQPLLQIRDWNLVCFICASQRIEDIVGFVLEKLASI